MTETKCQRCGGQMCNDYYGEGSCLQCGYNPKPSAELLDYLMAERNRSRWGFRYTKKRVKRVK